MQQFIVVVVVVNATLQFAHIPLRCNDHLNKDESFPTDTKAGFSWLWSWCIHSVVLKKKKKKKVYLVSLNKSRQNHPY